MSQRVVVIGAAGQVGVDLMDYLRGITPPGGSSKWSPAGTAANSASWTAVGITRAQLDLTVTDSIEGVLGGLRPDVVVNLAAYTAVDRAESEPATAQRINTVAVGELSRVCESLGAHFLTVSTDYVFDGRSAEPYDETALPHPQSVYGASKRDGELLCRPDDTIVRTSWVMGVRARNIAHIVAQRAASNEPVRFVTDQIGTPTMAADLALCVMALMERRPGGVVHVANTGVASWFDVASFVAMHEGRSADFVSPIVTADLDPQPAAARPAMSALAMRRWKELGYVATPHWHDAMSRLLEARRDA